MLHYCAILRIWKIFNIQNLFSSFLLLLLISYGGLRVIIIFFLTSSILFNKNKLPVVFVFVVELLIPLMNLPGLNQVYFLSLSLSLKTRNVKLHIKKYFNLRSGKCRTNNFIFFFFGTRIKFFLLFYFFYKMLMYDMHTPLVVWKTRS